MNKNSNDDRPFYPGNNRRQRYIVKAVLAYAGFSLAWIFLSDQLLATFVNISNIRWLSSAKGFLYVLVTAFMLFLMMRAVPEENPDRRHLSTLDDMLTGNGKFRRVMFFFALLVSLAMLLVRWHIDVSANARPMLILFMLPVILSAVVGGLGPGLVATAVSALGVAYFFFPPTGSFQVAHAHDIFQLTFFVCNGVLVSILSEVLHRLRRRSEDEKQQQLVTLESIGDGVIATDIRGRVNFLNSEAARIIGWPREEALGRPLSEVLQVCGARTPNGEGGKESAGADGKETGNELMMLRSSDGRTIPISRTEARIQREDGTLQGEVLVIRDDTARRRAEEVLRKSEETYRSLFENMLNAVAHCRMIYEDGVPVDYQYLAVNPAFERSTGLRNVVGKRMGEIIPAYRRDDRESLEVFGRVAATGEPTRWEHYLSVLDSWYTFAIYSPKPGEFVAVADDITERKRAERALLDEYERRRVLTDNSRDGIVVIDQQYRIFEANRRIVEMLGYTAEEMSDLFVWDFAELSPEQRIWGNIAGLASAGLTLETRLRRKDGTSFAVEVSVSVTKWAGEQLVFCVCRDISERKRAEEEKRQLTQQLVQAQKMEAVGRLAGGVAHDFNNMLSVILGRAEIALDLTGPDDSRFEDLQEIVKAASRSAELTRQLLAFARKQTVSPKVLDLNDTVGSMLKMLRRLIGEDIDLLWSPGHGLWRVKMDTSQIDQMLANLAVNARDAIGGVGRVTIATANITFLREESRNGQTILPGDYVMLTISDTGAGMNEEVLEHIFEPFFTTKELGKGTGLGLSTVFGIVKQNDGFIEVESAADRGTVFRVYLPRCAGDAEDPLLAGARQEPPRGKETVLMVEDEPAILKLGASILRKLGYTVLEAFSPVGAIEVFAERQDEIALVITDVVMPEMNGRVLVERLREARPGLPCLYISGYTADAIAHHGVLDKGVRFLQKPFSVLELATQVRRALDEEED